MFLANLSPHANVYFESIILYQSIMQHKIVYMYITLTEMPLFTLIDMDDKRGIKINKTTEQPTLASLHPRERKK